MQIGTCLYEGKERIVRKDGDRLVLIDAECATSLRAALDDGTLQDLAHASGKPVSENEITFLPPVTKPEKILCIGFNYRGHLTETGTPIPRYPSVFPRFRSSQVGHRVPVIAPSISEEFDFEAELAVIIGKRGHRVKEADAMSLVAGYCCFAENSVRDFQMHARQVTAGKNFLSSGAIGPWLTTADAISDPATLTIIGRLNGAVVQKSDLGQLIFSIPQLIAYISSFTELLPGDIIATGTPDGVGFLRDPKIWLKPGDIFEVEVPGVGTLTNIVEAEAA